MKKLFKIIIFIIIFFYINLSALYSLNTIIFHDNNKNTNIDNFLEYYEDKSNNLIFKDIISNENKYNFLPNKNKILNLGYSNSAYWIKFKINNNALYSDEIFLEIIHPLINAIDLYFIDKNNNLIVKKNGLNIPFNQKEIKNKNNIFLIKIKYQDENTFYLKLKSDFYLLLPIKLYSEEVYLKKEILTNFILGMYYGIMLIILILNIFLFLIYLDKSYLFYNFFFLTVLMIQSVINNVSSQFLWPDSKWLNINSLPLLISLINIFGILFLQNFLETKKKYPVIDKILILLIILTVIYVVFSLIINKSISFKIIATISLLGILFSIITGVLSALKKNIYAVYYLLSLGLYLISSILMTLNALGIFQNKFYITFILNQTGSLFIVILLPLAILEKYNRLKKDKIIAEKTIEEKEKDKFASIGMLLGGISHEIYNPLSGINGPLDNLKKIIISDDSQNSEKIFKYLDYIKNNSERIENIINNIKSLYNKSELKKENFNLFDVADSVVEYYKKNKNKKINFILNMENNIILNGDKNALFQILNNLISNAVDAIKNEGTIKISFDKNSNLIKVTDSGKGINQNDLKNIFNAFFTTKNIENKNHIGLGLYIVKDLIIKMGWEIKAVSKPQTETSFIVTIK